MAPSCWLTWIKAREMSCMFRPRPPSAGPEVGLSLVGDSPTWCGTGSRQLRLQILPRDAARRWDERGRETQLGHVTCHVTRSRKPATTFRSPVGLGLWRHVLGGRGESAAPGQVCGSGAGGTGRETKLGRMGEAVVPLRISGPVWQRVLGSGWPSWSVRHRTQPRNPPHRVWGYASAGSGAQRLGCAFLPN